jgi:hypothetical protein
MVQTNFQSAAVIIQTCIAIIDTQEQLTICWSGERSAVSYEKGLIGYLADKRTALNRRQWFTTTGAPAHEVPARAIFDNGILIQHTT